MALAIKVFRAFHFGCPGTVCRLQRVFGQACAADQRANKLVKDKLHVNFRAVYKTRWPGGGQQGLTKPPETAAAVLLSKNG